MTQALFSAEELTALNTEFGTNLDNAQLEQWITAAQQRREQIRKAQSNYQNLLSLADDMANDPRLDGSADHIAVQNAAYSICDSRQGLYALPEFTRPI